MRKKACALVQHKDGWYALSLTATDHEIGDLRVYPGDTLEGLKNAFDGEPCAIAFDDAEGYLFNLALPFKGRRKISLVLPAQLEEMLPFPIDEMNIDFQEIGAEGEILAAALPRSLLDGLGGARHVRNVSLQSLSALYAVKCFKLLPHETAVFIHCTGSSAVIMVLGDQRITHLRHFIRSPQAGATINALREITSQMEVSGAHWIMVAGEDGAAEKQLIELALGISIDLLNLNDYISGENLKGHHWAGVGAALCALHPRGEINLSGQGRRSVSPLQGTAVYTAGGLACITLVLLGLSFLDLYAKQRTLSFLSREPNRLYRTVFPKVPPARDVIKAFEERIEAVGQSDRSKGKGDGPLRLLSEMSAKIDPSIDVKLTEFAVDDKEFSVSGTTVSFGSVDKIKEGLQQMSTAAAVELQSIDRVAAGQVRFKFRGKL